METREHDMEQRFAIFDEGARSRIYKVPICQTARLINEFPFRKMEIFETLNDAKEAALAIDSHEDLRKALLELTENRVERYYFS